jgi:ubiquinone biosynthesis protein
LTVIVTHLWRLLKWGRTLARHGALRGIEDDPLTPPQVARLARIARFGARIPPTPDYAARCQAIGPRRSSSARRCRPGPTSSARSAANLSQLQDDLPPAPFAAIRQTIEASFGRRSSSCIEVRRAPIGAASIAQVHAPSRPRAASSR